MVTIAHQLQYTSILTPDALVFLEALHVHFNKKRKELLVQRVERQAAFDAGKKPAFLSETQHLRNADWKAAAIPLALQDRRVEITGPVDRKMVINALNSGAKTFMADFEDSCSPTWQNLMEGQENLRDAVHQNIALHTATKSYVLNEDTATLLVRPRGLHLDEKHLLVGEELMSGSLVDFGLFLFHNVATLLGNDLGAYFYLPKLEHYAEARWWNEVFNFSKAYFSLPEQSIRVTVLIETLTASFQLDEIIYELKDYIAGLNCGRWDYIFSYIKNLKNHNGFLVPDRDQVTMTSPFMKAYTTRVVQVCHKRGILAIGGMAAQIPIKNDEAANEVALQKVRADKEREVKNGHDGTWVAHPGLVSMVMEIFDAHLKTPNQLGVLRDDVVVTEADLLQLPQGTVTIEGLRKNINVGILYVESWLMGVGAAALYHLMEDAATAEISRAQLWHWLQVEAELDNGSRVSKPLYFQIIDEEMQKIQTLVGSERFRSGQFQLARILFEKMIFAPQLDAFLTLKAYEYLEKPIKSL